MVASSTHSEMTEDLQRQSGDPNGSGDVTSPDSVDPLEAGATPNNAEKWKIKATKDFEEFMSSGPGYHGDTSTSSEKSDHRDVCWLKVIELAVDTLLSRQ